FLLLLSQCDIPSKKLGKNDNYDSFQWNGKKRKFLVHEPKTDTLKSPFLMVLHGGGGSPGVTVRITRHRINDLADSL
ncbi:MAG: hypothetical protein ABEH43_04715, partial [Flavobacteriales bacterium]